MPPSDSWLPESIGPFKILSRLGSGANGVVYEAMQLSPIRRVALKVLRGGHFASDDAVLMFQREIETLTHLRHPHIAAFYGSGRTERGEHYFAMELLRGVTLEQYLAARPDDGSRRELEHRLKLFQTLAETVHFAHQRGVIHRDLKPTNVVIIEDRAPSEGAETTLPDLRILDFGLARLTDADIAATRASEVGTIKGTLAYMSPEQTRGNPAEIDTRADVYSLGVVLYELLTGERPYDLEGTSVVEAARIVCEKPPTPLQGHPSSEGGGGRSFDSDLCTIVGKALEKEPDRRYSSAAAFAQDVGRYLAQQPILARPPSPAYQIGRFARRHRPAVVAAALALLALVIGSTVAGIQAVRATRAEQVALEARAASERDALAAREMSEFLLEAFAVSDPERARGEEVSARQVLDNAVSRIESELSGQPETRATLLFQMGAVYHKLGLRDRAEPLRREVLEVRRALLGEDHPDTVAATFALGSLYGDMNRLDEAEALLRDALARQLRLFGPEDARTLGTRADLGLVYAKQERHEEAVPHLAATLEAQRLALGPEHPSTLLTMNNLAFLDELLGRFDEAEPLYREALETQTRVRGEDHPRTLTLMNNLGGLHLRQGHLEEAAPLLEKSFDGRQRVIGERHPNVAYSYYNLGCLAAARGQRDEALRHLRRAVDLGWSLPFILTDRALDGLRGDAEFESLVEELRQSASWATES